MARFERPEKDTWELIARWRDRILTKVWGPELAELPTWQAFGIYQLRALYIAGTGFFRHRGRRQAAALTYATLLSLVPALALAFSLFKVWGLKEVLDEHFKPYLMNNLLAVVEAKEESGQGFFVSGDLAAGFSEDERAAERGAARGLERAFRASEPRISQLIDNWVDNIQTGRLALPNLIVLIFTVLFLLGAMEKALNEIWEVRQHRTLLQRIPVYWSVVTLGSVLIGFSLYYTTVIQNRLLGRFVADSGLEQVFSLSSVFLTWTAFFIFYTFLPNTKVRIVPAIVGSVMAGFCWELFKRAFTYFASSSSSYISIYGVFWSVPVFIVWVYLSWVIVLFGAEVVLAYQNIHQIRPLAGDLDARAKERIGVELCVAIARAFETDAKAPTVADLVRITGAPRELVSHQVASLRDAGLVAAADEGEEEAFVPGRPPDKTELCDILDVLRERVAGLHSQEKAIDHIFDAIDERERDILARVNLADLVAREEEPVAAKLSFRPRVRLRLKEAEEEGEEAEGAPPAEEERPEPA